MRTKNLILGLVVVLSLALALPGAVLATDTTEVTGSVTEGYTFTAPSTVTLGSMAPSATPHKASSTDGRLDGNNAAGYTVTGIDAKETSTGYMVSGSNVLTNKLKTSDADTDYVDADTEKVFLDTFGITGADIALYVSQVISYADPVATGYTITISFTVNPKT